MLVVPAAIGNERMKGPAGREWKTRGGRGLPKNRRGRHLLMFCFQTQSMKMNEDRYRKEEKVRIEAEGRHRQTSPN
jgi:hypothetical protein